MELQRLLIGDRGTFGGAVGFVSHKSIPALVFGGSNRSVKREREFVAWGDGRSHRRRLRFSSHFSGGVLAPDHHVHRGATAALATRQRLRSLADTDKGDSHRVVFLKSGTRVKLAKRSPGPTGQAGPKPAGRANGLMWNSYPAPKSAPQYSRPICLTLRELCGRLARSCNSGGGVSRGAH